MKKQLAGILALMVALSMTACSSDEKDAAANEDIHLADIFKSSDEDDPGESDDDAETEKETEAETEATTTEETTTTVETEPPEPAIEYVDVSPEDLEYNYDAVIKGVKITKYNGDKEAIRLPSEIDGDPVKYVSISNKGVKNIEFIFPAGTESIEDNAFDGCESLTSVVIPNGVTSIGIRAFEDCTGLTSISIPDTVKTIGGGAFYGCSGLTSITIPDGVTDLSEYFDGRSEYYGTFAHCTSLKEVSLPDTVETIGVRTFGNCTSLTEIKLPSKLKTIGYGAFSYCENLKSIVIPDGVTELPGNYSHSNTVFRGVFFSCTNLESVTLPSSLKKIGECAFINCESLKEVTISKGSKGVEVIDRSAFNNCDSLTEISIPDGVRFIGTNAFSGCENLTSVTIPASVKAIGQGAFANCPKLRSLTIPDTVEMICSDAFKDSDGVTVTYKGSEYNYSNFADLYNAGEKERTSGIEIDDIRYYYCWLKDDKIKYYIPDLNVWTNQYYSWSEGRYTYWYPEGSLIYDPEQDIWTDWDGNPVDYNP